MTIGREILPSLWFVQIRRNKAICASPPPRTALLHPHRNPLGYEPSDFGFSLLVCTQSRASLTRIFPSSISTKDGVAPLTLCPTGERIRAGRWKTGRELSRTLPRRAR